MRRSIIALFVLTFGLSFTQHATAQDRYFARTYTSNVLPQGAIDLELWHTSRIGHLNEYYNAQDQRFELEFGLGGNLQTSVYFNRYSTRFSDGPNSTALENEIGFSNEWKWKLSDPTANAVGFALYGEWGLKGGDELELETKLIFDKWLGNSLFAFNGVFEYEKTFAWADNRPDNSEWEAPFELDFGYEYLIKPKLGVGFELVDRNDVSKAGGWEDSVLSGGPTLNFRNDKWFILLNYLPQWNNVHKTSEEPSSKVLDKHERAELRIIAGVSF